MEQLLSCLDPKPGWRTNSADEITLPVPSESMELVGKHCILELYECNDTKLNDEAFIRETITVASKSAGATLLNLITHKFSPQGVTGLALLAESHMSIHTWPESSYAAVDVFTCGDHTMPEKACFFLKKEFQAKHHSMKVFVRETPSSVPHALRNPLS